MSVTEAIASICCGGVAQYLLQSCGPVPAPRRVEASTGVNTMFFPSRSGPKVSLGGRSTAREPSAHQLLERSRLERQKRQRKKDEERAAVVVQVRSCLGCRVNVARIERDQHCTLHGIPAPSITNNWPMPLCAAVLTAWLPTEATWCQWHIFLSRFAPRSVQLSAQKPRCPVYSDCTTR